MAPFALDHREIYLHTGHGTGIATAVWFDPATRVGGVLLITGPVSDRDGFIAIIRAMTVAGEARAAVEGAPVDPCA